ncbi:hypothetical protein A2U01_0073194 [Trifolium medium]|uniref:Uncharacterized protein n=1 Tax=Trifolium medium TaxID=97028 RepID=A0A392SVL4_9FABA|nr:hypothetical protein [Trifolium medium]
MDEALILETGHGILDTTKTTKRKHTAAADFRT